MKLKVFVLQDIFRKHLCNKNFLEKYNAEKCFDSQVLLDPFEKDFYLPAVFVGRENDFRKGCFGQTNFVIIRLVETDNGLFHADSKGRA